MKPTSDGKLNSFESHILRVDKYYRTMLPQSLVRRVGWVTADQSHNGWLLMGSPSRCRLLSATEVDNNPKFQSLRARITAELNAPITDALEFSDEVAVALALRLVPVEVTPPEPGWRLTLPKPVAAIMQIRPGESDVAALLVQGHIEFWTMELLRSSVTTPLSQII